MRIVPTLLAVGLSCGASVLAGECIELAGLVPAAEELPEGWTLVDPAGRDGGSTGTGIALLLGKLRRAGIAPVKEEQFGIATPDGPFEVAYALLPSGVNADEVLRKSVAGTGVAARMSGRILFLATTGDRKAIVAMAERFEARLARQLQQAAQGAEESNDSDRFLDCTGEFVAAFPHHSFAHLMIAEHLLYKSASPRPDEALQHLDKAIAPDGRPALESADRWHALYDRGVAESLLGRSEASIRTLRSAEATAPDAATKGEAQYQLAASLAMNGRNAAALAVLRRCFETARQAGQPVPSRMAASDIAFRALRDDAAFRALVGAPAPKP